MIDKAAKAESNEGIKSENDFISFYFELKFKAAGDCSAQVAKAQKIFDQFDPLSLKTVKKEKWFKIKVLQKEEYICIGTCISIPHSDLNDKRKDPSEFKKAQNAYFTLISLFEQMNSVDQHLTGKVDFTTSIEDILACK